jgi:hypothetical protein
VVDMKIKTLFSANYIGWNEYVARLKMRSWLNIMNGAAQESINNWWKNYKKDVSN